MAGEQQKEDGKTTTGKNFYFAEHDKLSTQYYSEFPEKDNRFVIIGHGSDDHVFDRSGFYVGEDVEFNSGEELHQYLSFISPEYKEAYDKKQKVEILLLTCNSDNIAKQLSQANPYAYVLGVQGNMFIGYDKTWNTINIRGLSSVPYEIDHQGQFNIYRNNNTYEKSYSVYINLYSYFIYFWKYEKSGSVSG